MGPTGFDGVLSILESARELTDVISKTKINADTSAFFAMVKETSLATA